MNLDDKTRQHILNKLREARLPHNRGARKTQAPATVEERMDENMKTIARRWGEDFTPRDITWLANKTQTIAGARFGPLHLFTWIHEFPHASSEQIRELLELLFPESLEKHNTRRWIQEKRWMDFLEHPAVNTSICTLLLRKALEQQAVVLEGMLENLPHDTLPLLAMLATHPDFWTEATQTLLLEKGQDLQLHMFLSVAPTEKLMDFKFEVFSRLVALSPEKALQILKKHQEQEQSWINPKAWSQLLSWAGPEIRARAIRAQKRHQPPVR